MFELFNKKPDFQIPSTGIDEIEELVVGGVKQKVLIQSLNKGNPILLFLHGGPSLPFPGISSRGKDYTIVSNTKKLVEHYTVVFWDQRGTGKSYNKNIPQETMNFNQFISDANEIIDYLMMKYKKKKIYLAGHSFGSLIGMYLINQYPEKFYSYIGLSQIIDWTENDRLSLKWLKEEAERRKDLKALKELKAVGKPPYIESFKQWGVIRKWQMKYKTMIYSDEHVKTPGLFKIASDMFLSKDYSFGDIVNTFYRGFKLIYTDEFIRNIPSINIQKDILCLRVPTTFIHGKKDVHVHSEPLISFVKNIKTEYEPRIIWAEKSSHVFHPDDTKQIEQIIIEELKHLIS
ncbi:alpha/beta fold hydrolase [Bacillus sp. FJAT-45350]|uniref:alpha/beta fold hydrolase n=1 Tax=Bacillus sp. FJAT-45350 TaxID=2011014 RepID=UPI00211BA82B|nr:alpha/beta hydrolase [Bacillus sp. FJAT-45350]